MTFTFQSSYWEHFRANAAVLLRIRSQVIFYVFVGLVGLVLILVWLLGIVTEQETVPTFAPALGIYLIGAFPIMNALNVWGMRRKNKLVKGKLTYSFSDEGLHTGSALYASTVRWDGIQRFAETRAFLLFFISARAAAYLPKRVLSSEDLASVRALVSERVAS